MHDEFEAEELIPVGCRWCGPDMSHPGEYCPKVKSIEYDEHGKIQKVEFQPEYLQAYPQYTIGTVGTTTYTSSPNTYIPLSPNTGAGNSKSGWYTAIPHGQANIGAEGGGGRPITYATHTFDPEATSNYVSNEDHYADMSAVARDKRVKDMLDSLQSNQLKKKSKP